MNTLPAVGEPTAGADASAIAFAALAAADERRQARLARMVRHDIIQALTTLRMDALWMRQHLGDRQQLDAALDDSMRLLQDVIARTWRLASELGAVVVEDLGLAAGLEFLADGFMLDTGVSCALDLSDDPGLDARRATGLFRIVQEWLAHLPAGARDVRVRLANDGAEALLVLEASFPGDQADLQTCLPATLAARVHLMAGDFTCSQPAAGRVRVGVRVDLQPSDAPTLHA
jgi:signal transduction histidine kinase